MGTVRRQDLVHPELSYKIVGCAFDVFNVIGGGHHEKVYQRALKKALTDAGIKNKEQIYYPLRYKGELVGKHYFDFLIEDKVLVEIKKGNRYSKSHIDQVLEYLRLGGLKLAIIINFATDGVDTKRIVRLDS